MQATVLCVASAVSLYAIGRKFLQNSVCGGREVPDASLRTVFSTAFAASGNLLVLLLIEAMNLGDAAGRKSCWKINAWTLCWFLIVFLPVYHAQRTATSFGIAKRRAWVLATGWEVIFLWLLWKMGKNQEAQKIAASTRFSLAPFLARLGALGATLMAILSGYGAVMMPFRYLNAFVRPVTSADVENIEWRIQQTQKVLGVKKEKLEGLMVEQTRNELVTQKRGLFGRILSNIAERNRQEEKINMLKLEINALEEVCRHLSNELRETVDMSKRHARAGTLVGLVFNWFGYATSGYCVWRLLRAILNLMTRSSGSGSDPVGVAAALTLNLLHVPIDASIFSQYLTLAFIAFVSANSIRAFLRDILKLMSLASSGASAGALALFFAEFMGLYCLSFILLVQQQLPPHLRQQIAEVFGQELEFTFFAKWFDTIFIASALFTMFMVFAHRKVTVQESYLEEGMLHKTSAD